MKLYFFIATFLLPIGNGIASSTQFNPDELDNPLQVENILHSPDNYDGKTIKVSGQVRTISSKTGKRGSEFLMIVIDGFHTQVEEITDAIKVFTYFSPRLQVGNRIIVSGVYHKSGHWAGSEFEHFIEAKKITLVEIN